MVFELAQELLVLFAAHILTQKELEAPTTSPAPTRAAGRGEVEIREW
jgi:hypothetical protein